MINYDHCIIYIYILYIYYLNIVIVIMYYYVLCIIVVGVHRSIFSKVCKFTKNELVHGCFQQFAIGFN